jgi:hypothetical protein
LRQTKLERKKGKERPMESQRIMVSVESVSFREKEKPKYGRR